MPPLLHPRSTATSTLFAGTLLASFVVVSIPHLFPCPRPRRQYLDGESQLRAAGLEPSDLPQQGNGKNATKSLEQEAATLRMFQDEARRLEQEARECPVPKPSGWIGRVMGFEASASATAKTSPSSKS